MTGIKTLGNLSDAEVLAMAGGKNLRIEGISTSVFGVLASKPLSFQKSSSRLLDMLQSSNYAIPLLILLAQARQTCFVIAGEKEPPKKLADLFDNVSVLHSIRLEES
jgi:THO complex subunit 2